MKKLAIILMWVVMSAVFGCVQETEQQKQARIREEKIQGQDRAIEQEIQAIRSKYSSMGGQYITDKEKDLNYYKKQQEICEVFVGKTFWASTEDSIFNKFYDKPSGAIINGFKVKSPERFTIVKFGKGNDYSIGSFSPFLEGWYEVKFESGKKAFVQAFYFKYVTNPPVEVPTE